MIEKYTDLEVRIRDFARSLRREEGASAVEYGLLVALIAIVIIAAVALVGTNLDLTFDEVGASL
jgi:pilus assembly protein Flp/PilA